MPKSKEKAKEIVFALKEVYPEAICALEHGGDGYKLLIMGRLSAQCTDKRVNLVCKDLFKKYPTVYDLAAADLCDIEEAIRPCGLYHTKARDIKSECLDIINKFSGKIPDNMEDLLSLCGVGRKIANLVLGDYYKKSAIVTDTHCIRICGKLGFYPESEKRPYKIEKILEKVIEPAESSDFCHRLVMFGRDVCTARSPKCGVCPLKDKGLCDHGVKNG